MTCNVVNRLSIPRASFALYYENEVRLHLHPFQERETFGMDFDIVVMINCGSVSIEYLEIQAT
jgi:hypothetical protein